MKIINKPIDEVVRTIISCTDPESGRAVFKATGNFDNGSGNPKKGEASLDDIDSLKMPEYRIVYSYGAYESDFVKVLSITTNRKKPRQTFVMMQNTVEVDPMARQGYERIVRMFPELEKDS